MFSKLIYSFHYVGYTSTRAGLRNNATLSSPNENQLCAISMVSGSHLQGMEGRVYHLSAILVYLLLLPLSMERIAQTFRTHIRARNAQRSAE